MANSKIDDNRHPLLTAVSSADGVTPVRLEADPVTGNLQVDASVSVSGSDGAILDGVSSSIKATVKDLTNSNPLATQLVDANGDAITSFGGGTQYTEGDTDASITGTAMLMEGAGNSLVPAQGTTANGLDVDVTRVQGTVTVDGSAVTQPVSHAALTELAAAIDTEVQVDVVGALPTGNNNIGDVDVATLPVAFNTGTRSATTQRVTIATDDSVPVTGTFWQATQPVSGTVSITANSAVNVAQMNGTAVTMGNGASGTGVQRVTLASDSTGQVALAAGTNAIGKLTANSGVDIGDVDVTSAVITGASVAHDAVDSANPIKIGYKAETSPKGLTLVADGDRTDAYADADGIQMVKLNTSGADVVSEAVSNTDGASTAFTNFSAVASTKNYITAYHVFRTDAGTSPIYVDFRDGTAGAVLWRAVIPAGGGSNSPDCAGPALFKTSANTALAFDVSAATTTVYINVNGYQSKV